MIDKTEKPKNKKAKKKFKIKFVNFGCFKLTYILCVCGEEVIAYESEKEHWCEKCTSKYMHEDVAKNGMLCF
jgi:hypothetical protein